MGSNIIELAKLGHERAAELKASCGSVDVRSFAQLISDLATQLEVQLVRSNALAAENAGLKNALEWLYETASSESVSIPDEKYSSVTNAAQVLSETPDTDAFLAEVRAQGVEMCAAEIQKQAWECDEGEGIAAALDAMELYSAQLRNGGAV